MLDRLPTFNVEGVIGPQEDTPYKNFPEFAEACYQTTIANKNKECHMAKNLQKDLLELAENFAKQASASKT
jgi:hypothetical protein